MILFFNRNLLLMMGFVRTAVANFVANLQKIKRLILREPEYLDNHVANRC